MQKSLELSNPLIETLTCLYPDQKTKATSSQKIRVVWNILACVKPEELTLLTDDWRIYAETDIPQEWIQKDGGSAVTKDHCWGQVLQLKTPLGSQKFSVLAKAVKSAQSLSHGKADSERSLSVNKKMFTKERSFHSNLELLMSNRGWNKKHGWTIKGYCYQGHVVFCERLL